ncbi:type II secretion system protein G [Rubritalea halochordaticola]|uniref:Type II secretion system core protein G n=1 Tax=Rubritalea halochordaticola TaxID=714537 RepID=A0ABP9V5P4_9BACT
MRKNSPLLTKPQNLSRGFTLMEMVMVMAIIAVLAGGVIGLMKNFDKTAEVQQAVNDIRAIESALKQYKTLAGRYPTTDQGLEALASKPTKAPVPRRYAAAMTSVPLDPWKNDYIYKMPGSKDPKTYELISKGPDGQEGTDDDISSQDGAE